MSVTREKQTGETIHMILEAVDSSLTVPPEGVDVDVWFKMPQQHRRAYVNALRRVRERNRKPVKKATITIG